MSEIHAYRPIFASIPSSPATQVEHFAATNLTLFRSTSVSNQKFRKQVHHPLFCKRLVAPCESTAHIHTLGIQSTNSSRTRAQTLTRSAPSPAYATNIPIQLQSEQSPSPPLQPRHPRAPPVPHTSRFATSVRAAAFALNALPHRIAHAPPPRRAPRAAGPAPVAFHQGYALPVPSIRPDLDAASSDPTPVTAAAETAVAAAVPITTKSGRSYTSQPPLPLNRIRVNCQFSRILDH